MAKWREWARTVGMWARQEVVLLLVVVVGVWVFFEVMDEVLEGEHYSLDAAVLQQVGQGLPCRISSVARGTHKRNGVAPDSNLRHRGASLRWNRATHLSHSSALPTPRLAGLVRNIL